MKVEQKNQLRGCLSKKILVVACGLVLLNLVILTFCAWSLGVPATLALKSVPVPSDADMQIDNRQFFNISEDGPKAEMMYYVYRPWTEVVSFYREEMGKRGWKTTKEETEARSSVTEVCMKFQLSKIFVASVDILGYKADQGQPESTTVIVHTIMKEQISCK